MMEVAYVCDGKQCEPEVCKASPYCTHTTNIEHAKNFIQLGLDDPSLDKKIQWIENYKGGENDGSEN